MILPTQGSLETFCLHKYLPRNEVCALSALIAVQISLSKEVFNICWTRKSSVFEDHALYFGGYFEILCIQLNVPDSYFHSSTNPYI